MIHSMTGSRRRVACKLTVSRLGVAPDGIKSAVIRSDRIVMSRNVRRDNYTIRYRRNRNDIPAALILRLVPVTIRTSSGNTIDR
jgi:hypothetical protein